MDRHNKFISKLTVLLLLYVMLFNQIFSNVVLDPNSKQNTSLDISRNGIPIVNISTPNNHGVSVNNFLEYNVGKEGQVLNNADNIGRSHLAGIINANPNLGPHQAANLVILQVNGANRSQIEGYIEALSREKVNVILSNENGIYLDGAGTINIRNFIPTTGKVNLFDGQYIGIDVSKGQVVIGANGFNGKDTDYIGIITKALELQGSIVANELDVITGENKVDSKGNITSKGGVNSVAIDAYNLGSMYAGQVKIIATDRGAGVNSSSLIYSKDKKLEITADGKVRVATIKGQGIDIKASEYEQTELASSDKDININAQKISLQGETQATEDINLAGNVLNSSDIYTNKDLKTKNLTNSGNINVVGNLTTESLNNTSTVNIGKNLGTKNINNTGNINVSNLTNIDGKLDNKGSLVSIGDIKVQGNVLNTNQIYTRGSLRGDELFNAGEITVLKDISTKSIENKKEIISGKGIETGTTKNSGEILISGKLDIKGNVDNIGILEAQTIEVKGDKFSNKGNVSSDNISVEVQDTKNDGVILSSNDIDLNTKTLSNTNKILAVKDINTDNVDLTNTGEIASNNKISLNNTNTKNNGKIVSNGEIQLNNSSITNSGEILSDNVEMKDNKNYTNTGSIKGNKTTLTTTKDIDLIGELHGEENLTIKGNNISNNGKTTGKGTIDISSNDFVNNKELSSYNLTINSTGNILNNNILGGENATIKSSEFDNKDLVSVGNNLDIETTGNIVNRKNSVIYTGNNGKLTGSEILNLEGEILGGNLELNGKSLVLNEVGLIQSERDLKIESPIFQNIGRVRDLDKYETYYETWDGREVSEVDLRTNWVKHYEPRSWKGSDAIRYQEQWFDELALYSEEQTGYKSYIFSNSINSVKRYLGLEGDYFVHTNSAEIPVKALEGKIRSNATTEYGRVIAGQDITIDSKSTINKDSIISAGNKVEVKADTIDNSSTVGNAVQLLDGREKVYIHYKNSSKDSTNAYLRRELVQGGTGYITGQPTVIEGRTVKVDSTKILPQSIPEAKGILNETSLGEQVIPKNIDRVSGISSKNSSVQIVGNVQNISNVINTGVININPILNSAMFTTNLDPSSKYLLETRSEYVSLNRYFGSDYFLTRVSYKEDWNRAKRLGDAYYENQLITRALNEKLGTAFLNNLSGQELIQSMIDNASEEQKRLGLEVGKELTKEQIANLQDDIIWYVETEVNGVKVLSPQVYLSSKSRNNLDKDDRDRIGGTLYTDIKTKDLENKGLKLGNTGITKITADTLRNETVSNRLSEISGDRVYVETKGDIENIGGKILGREIVSLKSEDGNIINNGQKLSTELNMGEYDRTRYENIGSVGEIQGNRVKLDAKEYISEGGLLLSKNLETDLDRMDIRNQELRGSDKSGTGSKNYRTFDSKENVGSAVVSERATGRIGEVNVVGSIFDVEDGKGLDIGRVKVQSSVNEYDEFSLNENRNSTSKSSRKTESHTEENVAGTFRIGANANIQGTVESIGSNIDLGDNAYVGGKITTDSRELHNSYYEENKKSGFTGSIGRGGASVGYGRSRDTYDEKSLINAKSNLYIGDGSTLNQGAEITATNFVHGNISINNGDVLYGARKDTKDIHTTSKSSWVGVSANINSPAVDRIRQIGSTANQLRSGDTLGGAMNVINIGTGVVSGLAGNQGNRLTNYDEDGSVGRKGVIDAQANNNFYANIGVSVGANRSRSESNSHQEGAVATTITGLNPNSTITYNNVNNITYQGTQARNTSAVYNNVENITKEAVELNNSYSSNSRSSGISAGATIGYGRGVQITGNGANITSNRSNMNTEETIYANGNFTNVNEVHNNTQNMTLRGFNQEGGNVSGSIANLEVVSLQNTSKTKGSSSGMNIGINTSGVPNSIGVNWSNTNGERAYVDNQSTFIVGEGSNLSVGRAENVGAVIGKQNENFTLKINEYVGQDIQNYDNMRTTGGSLGLQTGNIPVSNIGYNQNTSDKQGITRNTVVGNVEIGSSTGDTINRDLSRSNETTRDRSSNTNINVESQTIEYALNPSKFKEDVNKAKQEIQDIGRAIRESINDKGDDNRNFFGQLREIRLNETIYNIAGERLDRATTQEDMKGTLEATYKDLGYDVNIRFSTPSETPELDGKGGTAYKGDDGKHTVIINSEYLSGKSKGEILGVISEEASHIINSVEGRTIATGTEEKGLESTGRATNEYFKDKYKDDNTTISLTSEGSIDTSKLGTNVGDKLYLSVGDNEILETKLRSGQEFFIEEFSKKTGGGQRGVELLKSILDDGGILSKNITEEEEKKVLAIFQENNKDKLKIITNIDGSREIVIEKEYNGIENLKNNYEKEKTLRVREILNSNVDFIVQPTEEGKILRDQNLNNTWNKYISAHNQVVSTQNNKISASVIFYNFDYNDKNDRTYLSIGDEGETIVETYKNTKPIEQHEFVIHPSDFAMESKGNFSYLSNTRNTRNPSNPSIIYFEDRYVEIRDSKGNKKYLLQPFIQSETNTLMFENMTMEYNKNNSRPRFYYQEDLDKYRKEFNTLEELKRFFDNGGR